MKKTMFITSVIMVVVMAIALTTSSLAWFTAQGSNEVSTSALTINAKANASAGIKISIAGATGPFYTTATLNSGNAVADMYPLLPVSDQSTPDADGLLAALDGKDFIGNTVDTNGKYDGTAYAGTGKYFAQNVWITNIAQGANAKAVEITPSIAFSQSGTAYSFDSMDPVLCVAVLSYDEDDDAELVALFQSNGETDVNVGRTEDDFASGDTVSTSYATIASGALETNSDPLPIPVFDEENEVYAAFGVAKQFTIIAWYDGNTLYNANSGFSIDFALTFEADDVA